MSAHSSRTVEDLTETIIDYRGKTPRKTTSGVKLVTAKVIKDGRILDANHEYIAEEDYEAWMRRGLPRKRDILLTTEAPLGEVAMLRSDERIALAQRVILLRGDPCLVDQIYYFYALRSPSVRAELNARATGTTVLGIKQSELRQVRIPWLPLPVQRNIAGILSSYDDLIENNTRRIAILEEMARRLYREWFVDFHFPGHDRVPTMESPIGPIPEAWKWIELGAIAHELRRSVDPQSIDRDTPYVGLEHIPRRSIALAEWGTAADVESTKLRFQRGEILFGKIRPYFHKVAVAPMDGISSSDAIIIAAKRPEWFPVVLCCVSSDEFIAHATQTSQGTKMPRANWDVLVRYPVALPPDGLLTRFGDMVADIVETIQILTFKNRNLRATRDLLLPKLFSGELGVADLEIAAGEVNAPDPPRPSASNTERESVLVGGHGA